MELVKDLPNALEAASGEGVGSPSSLPIKKYQQSRPVLGLGKRLETSRPFSSYQMRQRGSSEKSTGRGRGEKRAQAFCIHWPLVLPWTVPTPLASQAVLKSQRHSDRVDRPLKTAKCHACGTGPQVHPASFRKTSLAVPANTDAHTPLPAPGMECVISSS